MDKKAVIDPINLLVAIVALIGAGSFLLNLPNYGLILLIISTLIEAIARVMK